VTVHQTKQHARARRLADGPCDPGHRDFIQLFYIHILMISESSLL